MPSTESPNAERALVRFRVREIQSDPQATLSAQGETPPSTARAWLERGVALNAANRLEDALEACQTAIDRASLEDDLAVEAVALSETVRALAKLGDLPRALGVARLALQRAVTLKDRHLEFALTMNVGMLHGYQDQPEPYAQFTEVGLRIARELGDERLVVHASVNLAGAYARLHRFDEAEALYSEAQVQSAALELRDTEALILAGLGGLAGERGDLETCEALTRQSNDVLESLGNQHQIARQHLLVGGHCVRHGDLERALRQLSEAIRLGRTHAFTGVLADAAELQSRAFEGLGRFQEALAAARLAFESRQAQQTAKAEEHLRVLRHTHQLEATQREADHARSKAGALAETNAALQQTLDRLARQESDLRALLDALPGPVWVEGPRGPRWLNKAARALRERLEPGADRSAPEAWATNSPFVAFKGADGRDLEFEIKRVEVEFEGERSTVYALNDLTERLRLEAQVQHLDRITALGAMAAGVAHELNNPLAYMMANLTYVTDELARGILPPDDDRLRALQDTQEGAERMRGIVQGMKTLAAPTLCVETAIPLTYALIEAVEIVRPSSATPIVLDADIAPDVGVVGDQASWVQVFVNLLKNAVAACDGVVGRAPRVEIRVESTSAHRLALRISDNGRGIPVRHLGRIFEPFFTTREIGQGTGLGLAVCLSTVRGLGGQLTVESVEGQGTSVRVELVRSRLTAEL